jgi:ABC-type polar amino acid transport system ATPase subunit
MSEPILSIAGLRLSRGPRVVLDGVDLDVRQGERVALMGLSGGGKTTVLRAVCALEPFDAGRVTVGGFTLRPGPIPRQSHLGDLRRSVGMVFQFHHLFAHLTAVENVSLAQVHARGIARHDADARSRSWLESLGVGAQADARPSELSGGEAQRVAIARALAMDPPLLLMDEPTASLDPARRTELAAALAALTAAGRTLLVAAHDVTFAHAFATRVAVLAEGRVVEGGPPSEVLVRPAHPATRSLLLGNGD